MNNNGVYRGDEVNPTGGRDPSPLVFVKGARYEKLMEAFGGVGVLANDAGRASQRDGRSDPLAHADADQRGHRRKGGHGERPYHESQSLREEETVTAIQAPKSQQRFRNQAPRGT